MLLRGPSAVIGTPTYAVYVQRHEQQAAARGMAVGSSDEPLTMYANDGRWVADCPRCGAGIVADPDWPTARCFGCGTAFGQVVWPDAMADIEAVLTQREAKHQNWNPGETVDALVAENVARDLPPGIVVGDVDAGTVQP